MSFSRMDTEAGCRDVFHLASETRWRNGLEGEQPIQGMVYSSCIHHTQKNGANIMIGKFYNCTNGMWILDGMGNTKTIFQPGSFETSMKPEERWFPRISIQPFPLSWLWEKEIERVNNAAMSRKNFRAWICLVRCLEKVKHRNSINDGLLECPWS